MSEHSDFRAVLRAELVEAAAHPLPRRTLSRPRRRLLLPLGAIAAAAAAAVLAAVVLGRDHTPAPPRPAHPPTLPGRPAFDGTLEPGVRYRSRVLVPPISFVVSGPQWAVEGTSSSLGLQLLLVAPGYQPRLDRPLLGLGFTRVPEVIDPGSKETQRAPADLVAWLQQHPDLRVSRTERVTVAGRPATRLDFSVVRDPTVEDPVCRQRYQVRCLWLAPQTWIDAGSAGRIYVVADRRGPLVVAVTSSAPKRLRALTRAAAPIIRSLRIAR
jgi:hypothetical protein